MASAANGPYFPDPFRHDRSFTSTFMNAILATALFRCWHLLIFFGAWSSLISVVSHKIKSLGIASTLLTVFVTMLFCLGNFDFNLVACSIGTVLGFVISYRTTSSFERYNEGRKYWSQIVFASRTIARLIWFHVPGKY
jgi:putative membrane protein